MDVIKLFYVGKYKAEVTRATSWEFDDLAWFETIF